MPANALRMYQRLAGRVHGGDDMGAALKLFDDLEIRYVPPNEQHRRGPMATSCVGIVDRMIRTYGLPHTTLTLRTIVELSEVNQSALIADIINAVSEVILSHPRWANLGLHWLSAFDNIDLLEIRRTAKAANVQPLRVGIATLVAVELTQILGPSRPPKSKPVREPMPKREPKPPRSLTRVPGVEANVNLGVELLALRATAKSNCAFGRLVRAHGIDMPASDVTAAMWVARLYADRPEIFTRLSWGALTKLASPTLTPRARQAIEVRIAAGEKIVAADIVRARQAHAAQGKQSEGAHTLFNRPARATVARRMAA